MPKPPKYSEFREVVETLIKEYNRSEVSEFVMMDFEYKLIDYVVDSDYGIYVRVPYGKWSEYFEVSDKDLSRFVRDSSVVVKIEELSLYTEVNEALSDIYYEEREPDEYGNYPECPEIPKELPISSELFRIRKNDLPDLLEDIKADALFGLKVKEGVENSTLIHELPQKETNDAFIRNGNVWTISYEGNTLNLVDSKGLKYIHYLLSNPKKEIDALMLQREIDKIQPSKYKNRSEGTFIEEELKISRIGNTKTKTAKIRKKDELDYSIKQSEIQAEAKSKQIYEERENLLKELNDLEDIKDIKEEEGHLDETIVEKIAVTKDEITRLTKILANYGKGEIADIEKARSAVKNTINNSLGKIKESHSSLWEHLDSSIKRRSFCSYTPAKHISWVLSP